MVPVRRPSGTSCPSLFTSLLWIIRVVSEDTVEVPLQPMYGREGGANGRVSLSTPSSLSLDPTPCHWFRRIGPRRGVRPRDEGGCLDSTQFTLGSSLGRNFDLSLQVYVFTHPGLLVPESSVPLPGV